MNILNENQIIPATRSVVSVGNYDGVHTGHGALVQTLVERAQKMDAVSVVVTFEPHTRTVLSPDSRVPLLTTFTEKCVLLERCGVDYVARLHFTPEFSTISPSRFVQEILVNRLHAVEWVLGENHTFGKGGQGDRNSLREHSAKHHINTFVSRLTRDRRGIVSSTGIRHLLDQGDITGAIAMLGQPYLIAARRVGGIHKGTEMGVPTVNFAAPASDKVMPPAGVYAAALEYEQRRWFGALYCGDCPTFSGREFHLEFHALSPEVSHFPGEDACGLLWVYRFIRPDKAFATEQELVEHIHTDIERIQAFFSQE